MNRQLIFLNQRDAMKNQRSEMPPALKRRRLLGPPFASTVNQRLLPFIRIVTAAWTFLAFLGFAAPSSAESIGLYFDSATPQIAFAAGDIKAALEKQKHTVQTHDLAALAKAGSGQKIVLAIATDKTVASALSAQGGKPVAGLGAQAYALRTTTKPSMSYWVLGGDANGAMYGGLEIADNIKYHDLTGTYDSQQSPHVLNRGVKANLPLDKRSPTYFGPGDGDGVNKGTAAQKAINNVWDMDYWKEWFDEMARNRFNVLAIWNCHPFPALGLDMPESFSDVQGYDGYSKKMSKAEKVAFWKGVMAYGKSRGFQIYFVTWNIYTHGTDISTSPTSQASKDYFRKAVRLLFETYPDLTGLGVSAGENMRGLNTEAKITWLAQTYGKGVEDYARANPGREIHFLHRWLDADVNTVVNKFGPMLALTNVYLDMTFKYSLAHMYSTPDPAWIYIKDGVNAVADLDKTGKKTWLELRNDDFYFLSWGDPQFARDFIAGFPDVKKYVAGFMMGGDGWVSTRDFTSKSNAFTGMLEIKREWFAYRLWGRLSYNPQTPNEVFIKEMAFRFPGIDAPKLFDAWTAASRGVPLAAELVMGSDDGQDGKFWWDWQWWPELCTSAGGLKKLDTFMVSPPAEGSDMCGISQTAEGNCAGKPRTSFVIADTIEKNALGALEKISSLDAKGNAALVLYQKNIRAQIYLSLYYAEKIRGATFKADNHIASARSAMGKAYCHWINYTTIMNELHTGAAMERTRSFGNWSTYNAKVLEEFTNLGGVGIPSCEETTSKQRQP